MSVVVAELSAGTDPGSTTLAFTASLSSINCTAAASITLLPPRVSQGPRRVTETETATASPAKPTAGSAYRRRGGGSGAAVVGGDVDIVGAVVEIVGAPVEVVGLAVDVVGVAVDAFEVMAAAVEVKCSVVEVALEIDVALASETTVDAITGSEEVDEASVGNVVDVTGTDIDVLLASIGDVDNDVVNTVDAAVEIVPVGANVGVVDIAVDVE